MSRPRPSSSSFASEPADVAVQPRDHRGLALVRVRPGLARVLPVVGHLLAVAGGGLRLVVGVGDRDRQVQEEGLRAALVDPAQGRVHDHVVRVLDPGARPARSLLVLLLGDVAQRHAGLVAEEERGVVVVGVALVEVAEEGVEAHAVRVAGGARLAQAPLAEEGRRVARVLEEVGERALALAQGLDREGPAAGVAPHAGVAGVAPGHEHGARGRADRRAGVEVGEAQALGGQPVEVRRANELLAVGADVAVAEVVGEDEDDVRPRRGSREHRRGRQDGRQGRGCDPESRAHRPDPTAGGARPPASPRRGPRAGRREAPAIRRRPRAPGPPAAGRPSAGRATPP